MNRRRFLEAAGALAASRLTAQTAYEWGGPVLDIHLHLRQNPESDFDHIQGSGVTKAVLLTRFPEIERAKAAIAAHPGRFVYFVSTDVTRPEAADLLTKAVKAGALGMGEIKYHVACDGPEMQRIYALAAELSVPVTIHFGDVAQARGEGTFNSGFTRFAAMLKKYPKTKFIAHADTFWANISGDYKYDTAYPSGPVKPGGLSDKWLSDYPNLYGDMSANSCNNALNRDPDFSAGFLDRHQTKLMIGSDCSCTDGHGTGQPNKAPRLQGKCIARETLALTQKLTSPAAFAKIRWENGTKLLGIPA